MTPKQMIKEEILHRALEYGEIDQWSEEITKDNIDELYQSLLVAKDLQWDCQNEFRELGEKTKIEDPFHRSYESYSVAYKLRNGQWVGWIYWHEGGPKGNAEEIDWMSDAYFVEVAAEREKVVIIRDFKRTQ